MRHKLLSLIVPFTLMVSLMAIPAKAGEGEWDIAVGLKAHLADISTSGSEREGNAANTVTEGGSAVEITKTSVSKSHEVGSIFLEFVGRSGIAGITAGGEWIPGTAALSATQSRTDTASAAAGVDAGTYTAKAEVENLMTFYLEPTLYFNDNFGLYAKGGVTTMDLNTLESITFGTDSAVYPNKRMIGGVVGAGVRYKHSSGFLVKLEYAETNFKPVTLDSDTGNKNRIKAEIDYTATTLAIGWQF